MDALSTACRPSTSNLLHWHNRLCQNFHQLPGWFPAQQHASRSCHYFFKSDMLQSWRSLVAVIVKKMVHVISRTVQHLQGSGAAEGDERGDRRVGGRQVRLLPRAAAKAAAGRLALLQVGDDVPR